MSSIVDCSILFIGSGFPAESGAYLFQLIKLTSLPQGGPDLPPESRD